MVMLPECALKQGARLEPSWKTPTPEDNPPGYRSLALCRKDPCRAQSPPGGP